MEKEKLKLPVMSKKKSERLDYKYSKVHSMDVKQHTDSMHDDDVIRTLFFINVAQAKLYSILGSSWKRDKLHSFKGSYLLLQNRIATFSRCYTNNNC